MPIDIDFILVDVPSTSLEYKEVYDDFLNKFGQPAFQTVKVDLVFKLFQYYFLLIKYNLEILQNRLKECKTKLCTKRI